MGINKQTGEPQYTGVELLHIFCSLQRFVYFLKSLIRAVLVFSTYIVVKRKVALTSFILEHSLSSLIKYHRDYESWVGG